MRSNDESPDGMYPVLLRVEASDEREADTSLAAVGAGPGVVHRGAVAGFPMPTLRYYVGNNPPPEVVADVNADL